MSDTPEYLYILTASADFLDAAVREVRRAAPKLRWMGKMGTEMVLVGSSKDMAALHSALLQNAPIFLRHIVPAQQRVPLSGERADDLEALARAAMAIVGEGLLEKEDRFSVQARVVSAPGSERPYSPYAIADAIAPRVVEATGATMDVRHPEIVVSVLATAEEGFVGISPVEFNRSDWAGGERRFRREAGQLSRAEFKLLEALDLFGVALPQQGDALDLGAAPGGWTRLLRLAGLRVTAVDPAALDPSVVRDGRVEHVRRYAEEWLAAAVAAGQKYDVVLNDIRMDARDAARLMVQAAPLLHRDAFALLTLKLPGVDAPGMDAVAIAHQALAELGTRYRTVRARQLFHNRNEVMVLLAP